MTIPELQPGAKPRRKLTVILPRIDRDSGILLGIVLIALFLRLAFFTGINWDDDPYYVYLAWMVMKGKAFLSCDIIGYRIGVYYPIAAAYALFGINNFAAGSYALLVSLSSVVVAYKLGKLLYNPRTGLLAALLLAFYPLDVELASRPMPDGLLAGFSLFAIYFLFAGDLRNFKSSGRSLEAAWSYVASGLLLGWCALINLSAVVVLAFVAVYFFFSLWLFRHRLRTQGLRIFIRVVALRYILLTAAFLLVTGIEGACYYEKTGDFLFKYRDNFSHYLGNHGFNRDLFMYPRIMFHMQSNPMQFHFQGWEWSYYGFYYLLVPFALAWGLAQGPSNFILPALWLIIVFCDLEWGSVSLTRYIPFHRLPRHLSLCTPPMILCLSAFLGNLKPERARKYLAPLLITGLIASSLAFSYFRHQSLRNETLAQNVIHHYFDHLRPERVYADNNTIAYQKFLERFEERGPEYIELRSISLAQPREGYAIIGEFPKWRDAERAVLNDGAAPDAWKLDTMLTVEQGSGRPPLEVKIYKVRPVPIPRASVIR